MGSLMGGWDSHVHDAKSIKLERNRSMTKEGIETYWRSKKNIIVQEIVLDHHDEDHVLKPCHTFSEGDQKNETGKVYNRSDSLPVTNKNVIIEDEDDEENQEALFKNHGWWINSRWAFLNEPPVLASETPFRYASQFHVAHEHIDNSNNNHTTTHDIIA